MIIKKRSAFTGIIHELDLDITIKQLERWNNGELIQNVFTNLSDDEREFLMTGITPDEWDIIFDLKKRDFSKG